MCRTPNLGSPGLTRFSESQDVVFLQVVDVAAFVDQLEIGGFDLLDNDLLSGPHVLQDPRVARVRVSDEIHEDVAGQASTPTPLHATH